MAFDLAALQRHQALMVDLQLLQAEKAAIEQSVGLDSAADELVDVARRAAAAKRASKADRFKGPRPAPTRRSVRVQEVAPGAGSSSSSSSSAAASSSSSSLAALAAPATWASLSPAVRARELRRRALPKLPGVAKVFRCVPGWWLRERLLWVWHALVSHIAPRSLTQHLPPHVNTHASPPRASTRRSFSAILEPPVGTCHWCRQKTGEWGAPCCIDGCGAFFCGECLRSRHREDVLVAHAVITGADPSVVRAVGAPNMAWVCPICRGCCNCSGPCMREANRSPSRQVSLTAYERGVTPNTLLRTTARWALPCDAPDWTAGGEGQPWLWQWTPAQAAAALRRVNPGLGAGAAAQARGAALVASAKAAHARLPARITARLPRYVSLDLTPAEAAKRFGAYLAELGWEEQDDADEGEGGDDGEGDGGKQGASRGVKRSAAAAAAAPSSSSAAASEGAGATKKARRGGEEAASSPAAPKANPMTPPRAPAAAAAAAASASAAAAAPASALASSSLHFFAAGYLSDLSDA